MRNAHFSGFFYEILVPLIRATQDANSYAIADPAYAIIYNIFEIIELVYISSKQKIFLLVMKFFCRRVLV